MSHSDSQSQPASLLSHLKQSTQKETQTTSTTWIRVIAAVLRLALAVTRLFVTLQLLLWRTSSHHLRDPHEEAGAGEHLHSGLTEEPERHSCREDAGDVSVYTVIRNTVMSSTLRACLMIFGSWVISARCSCLFYFLFTFVTEKTQRLMNVRCCG